MRLVARAAVVALVALAACRGGVKSGLRAWERPVDAPPATAAAPAPAAPPRPAPAVAATTWRVEYYKISDG